MSAFLREIPLLVWLAVCFAAAWCRKAMCHGDHAKEPGSEIPPPPPRRYIAWRVNLSTGTYRRIV